MGVSERGQTAVHFRDHESKVPWEYFIKQILHSMHIDLPGLCGTEAKKFTLYMANVLSHRAQYGQMAGTASNQNVPKLKRLPCLCDLSPLDYFANGHLKNHMSIVDSKLRPIQKMCKGRGKTPLKMIRICLDSRRSRVLQVFTSGGEPLVKS